MGETWPSGGGGGGARQQQDPIGTGSLIGLGHCAPELGMPMGQATQLCGESAVRLEAMAGQGGYDFGEQGTAVIGRFANAALAGQGHQRGGK
jgi:hypothetical protein